MKWNEVLPGDVVAKLPLGKYPIWACLKNVGPRVDMYMNMETAEMQEVLRKDEEVEEDWVVIRAGRTIHGKEALRFLEMEVGTVIQESDYIVVMVHKNDNVVTWMDLCTGSTWDVTYGFNSSLNTKFGLEITFPPAVRK